MSPSASDVVEAPGAVIIGAGIAGLYTALKLAPFPALVLSAAPPGFSGSSIWAQGGIAAALDAEDSWELHAADTISASAGLGDPEVAAFVTREASGRIEDLVRLGVPFDRDADGKLALGREGAHSRSRIVHVSGDRAGAEIMRALAEAVSACPSIRVVNNANAVEFATNDKRIVGVYAWPSAAERSQPVLFTARAVILASGGVGALYSVTTNPPEANGAGLGLAARAGALIADPEFVQFHPTAINIGRDPAPLATEALRGEGAVLIDELGRRFMQDAHPAGELAPRDVVARTIFREMTNGHRVFLDCRAAPGERFAAGFPTVYAVCRRAGIDPAKDPIPVAPAAHYHMGGVATDHHGRSSMPGLWSVGECASTGLHGANRLASNSLLEALVLGARAAEAVQAESQDTSSWSTCPLAALEQPGTLSHGFRASMMRWVGLERDAAGLTRMLDMISETESSGAARGVENSLAAAKLIVAGALSRRESVGAHLRSDFPRPSASLQRTFMTLADAENIAVGAGSGDLKLRAAQR